MAKVKRLTAARARAVPLSRTAALQLGMQLRAARVRRRLTQRALASRVGTHQGRISQLERGEGGGAPLELWFAAAIALDRPLRVEFGRQTFDGPRDAGHLDIQELVLRLAKPVGFAGTFEIPTRPSDPIRSTDVRLVDRDRHCLVLVECWNTFGDLGGAARSSDRKLAETKALAVALGTGERSMTVGLCWVVRDTKNNRELIARYPHIFEARFPGSSLVWLRTLTQSGATVPSEPGLVWCDPRARRLFARRAPLVK